jgi:hypothetical protein
MSQDKPTINITSNNQQGGITAYQVNIGRIDLVFDETIANAMMAKIPKDRPFGLQAIGSPRDWAVAERYAKHLQNNGYQLSNYTQIGNQSPPPDSPITIVVRPESTSLIISPRT